MSPIDNLPDTIIIFSMVCLSISIFLLLPAYIICNPIVYLMPDDFIHQSYQNNYRFYSL